MYPKEFEWGVQAGRRLAPKAINSRTLSYSPGVPFNPSLVSSYALQWRTEGFPEQLLDKILDNVRYLSHEEFDAALNIMAQQVRKDRSNKAGFVLVSHRLEKHSGGYVIKKLRPLLENPGLSDDIPPLDCTLDILTNDGSSKAPYPLSFQKSLAEGRDFVFVDDGAYSGLQVQSSIEALLRAGVPAERVFVYLVGATNIALSKIPKGCSTWTRYNIPTVAEIFSREELDQLAGIPILGTGNMKFYPYERGIHEGTTMTVLPHKSSDTTLQIIAEGNDPSGFFIIPDIRAAYKSERATRGL